MEYTLGGLSACGACLFTNPIEVVKIRLQLQGELQARGQFTVHYRNVFHAFYTVARDDGLLGLQKGLVPALWYQLFMNGTRLGLYHFLEDKKLFHKKNGQVSTPKSILAGAFAGCVGAYVASPLFLIKTQLQAQSSSSFAVGYQHHHTGFVSALGNLYRKQGIIGLWRGSTGSLLRVAVGSAAQLATFSNSREVIEQLSYFPSNSWQSAFLASSLSGVAVVLCMTPFDVVSTRLYNQGLDSTGRGLLYSGPIDCLVKTYRVEGLPGLYKGSLANYLRIAPHSVITLVLWTHLRQLKSNLNLVEDSGA